MGLKMKELPTGERPYEKCVLSGAKSLDDAELLSVFFRTGVQGVNSVELARNVIASCGGSLAGLYGLSYADFKRIPGIGTVKAVQLECLKVLSERMVKSRMPVKSVFSRPDTVFSRYAGEMRQERQEVVKALFLNGKCALIREYEAARGSVNSSLVPVRDIFVEALKSEAVYLLLMHNHPSGDPEPSPEDFEVTKRVAETGRMTGVVLLDHMIFGANTYYSMREKGNIR